MKSSSLEQKSFTLADGLLIRAKEIITISYINENFYSNNEFLKLCVQFYIDVMEEKNTIENDINIMIEDLIKRLILISVSG